MNQTQYFTLTQMIIDDVYFPWGATKLNQLGGGTYTVAGTRVWSDQVGFCCLIGPDFEETYSKWFRDNQIDMATVLKEKNTCHAKIHYFEDGEREELLLPGCGSHYEMSRTGSRRKTGSAPTPGFPAGRLRATRRCTSARTRLQTGSAMWTCSL